MSSASTTSVNGPNASVASEGVARKCFASVTATLGFAPTRPDSMLAPDSARTFTPGVATSPARLVSKALRISALSSVPQPAAATRVASCCRKASVVSPRTANTRPGLVQNWPTPSVKDSVRPCASASVRVRSASGSSTSGFRLLISANTGMGLSRRAATSNSALPAACEPVKPTAAAAGWRTSDWPSVAPPPCNIENTPAGTPVFFAASLMAPATSSPVPGCARCAFTTTGQPTASAEAVSPPAVEKASGKLLEPNTTTGPSGNSMRRRSGRGAGCRSGSAVSMRASTQEPSRTTCANSRSCPQVRPRSPVMRATGRPVSATARWISTSPSASMLAAICSRKPARTSGALRRYSANAAAATSIACAASASEASWNTGCKVSPVAGFIALKLAPRCVVRAPATRLSPCNSIR